MHFIIFIPIILLIKLILWVFGILLLKEIFLSLSQFIQKYRKPIAISSIILFSYLSYLYFDQTRKEIHKEEINFPEVIALREPSYTEQLQHHKKFHKDYFEIKSIKIKKDVLYPSPEEIQFSIDLKNISNKTIVKFDGKIMIWDKNNKFIGDYNFNNFHRYDNSYEGHRWDRELNDYVKIKDSDDWVSPNQNYNVSFAYNDESLKNYKFVKYKYIMCIHHIIFKDKSEYIAN